jgi:hypothetical protein
MTQLVLKNYSLRHKYPEFIMIYKNNASFIFFISNHAITSLMYQDKYTLKINNLSNNPFFL